MGLVMSSSCCNFRPCQEEKYSAVDPQGNRSDLGPKLSSVHNSLHGLATETPLATQGTTGSLLLGSKARHAKKATTAGLWGKLNI